MNELDTTRFRRCCICRCWKPQTTTFYGRNGRYWSGRCRVCHRLYARDWHALNRDKRAAQYKAWYEANREAKREYDRRFARDNPELIAAYPSMQRSAKAEVARRYRERNRAAVNARNRLQLQQRRAGREYDQDDLTQMYEDQGGLCAYCETPLNGAFHVEHMIPVIRGGTGAIENIALACPPCNRRKSGKTAEEFMALLLD